MGAGYLLQGSSLLFDAVRRFVALSKQVSVKGSDPEVKELMVALRRGGFSSTQISELSGGEWSSTLIRQYTVGWGGVDIEVDNKRKSLMTPLRELVSSEYDIKDVEGVLSLNRSVRAKGSRLEEVAELNSNLIDLDMLPGEIGMLVTLSSKLLDQHITPRMVARAMALDQELVEAGFNKTVRILLRDLCEKYGGVDETLKAVNEFNYLSEIQRKHSRLKEEVERLSSVKEEFDTRISQNRNMINAVNDTRILGFDTAILAMISVLAKNLGGPLKVVDVIQKYSSIREIDAEQEAKKAELEKVNKEISDKTQYLTALKYTLKEAKEVYEKSSDVRLLVELLSNPRGIKMDKSEVGSILTRVLDSSIQRIEEKHEILSIPDPEWDTVYESLKALADRLRQFAEET